MAKQKTHRRENGTGAIVYDADAACWIGRLDLGRGPDGRRRRTKVRGKSRAEVRAKLDQLNAHRDAGIEVSERVTTFAEVAAAWLERGLPSDITDSTRANYERILRVHVLPMLGPMRVSEIRSQHVETVLDGMAERERAASTMRHALNLTRRILRYAMARDIVGRNVAEPVLQRRGPRAERRGLSPKQARALLRAARDDRLGNLLTVSLLLGLRPGEAAGLTWKQVKLDDPTPTLAVAASLRRLPGGELVLAEPKTATSRRRLMLPVAAADALRQQRLAQGADRAKAGTAWRNGAGLVFTTEVGSPLDPSNVRRSMNRLAPKADVGHIHPHLLRHAAASLLSAAGVPIEDISDTLGHRSIAVTAEIYRHPIVPIRSGHVAAMSAIAAGKRAKIKS